MRLLVVEDNRSLTANLFEYFEARGHVLDAAPDGITGLHLAVSHPYDVVVLDWMLPRLDGPGLLRRLRNEHGSGVPVIMLTARDELPDKIVGFRAGADDYLTKPFALPWPVVLVIHANHANELDGSVAQALSALRARGVRLYNQSVLLRGVNDDADALVALSLRLFELDVQPYYLHQLDRVAGTAHFEVDDIRAMARRQLHGRSFPGQPDALAGQQPPMADCRRGASGGPWRRPSGSGCAGR